MSFGGLYISISGLYANKKALDTVSHNISNTNNPDYVRQSAIHKSSKYLTSQDSRFQVGTGVDVEQIRQIRDEFLDKKFRLESEKHGYWNAKSEILHEVEMIFNEKTDSGIQNVMNKFWDSWDELSKEPDSLTIRSLVLERATAFTETVNHMNRQLENLQLNLNEEIEKEVGQINSILKDIVDMNSKIRKIESSGSNIKANDFRDIRNSRLDELSKLIPIKYCLDNTGQIEVSLCGRDIITSDSFNSISIQKNEKGYGEIYWSDTKKKIKLEGKGQLGGLIDSRDKVIEDYKKDLNTFVKAIADEVNKLHRQGKNLLKKGEKENFFINNMSNDGTNINSYNIRINPKMSDLNHIAASKNGDIGDGKIAKKISDLRQNEINDLNKMNFDNYYRDLISKLGLEREEARSICLNEEILLGQIDGKRESISGVTLDEEMSDMLKYQHSYVANSRVLNAIDEMIDNVVNRMGIAGR